MGAIVRPRIVGFELCSSCAALLWRCSLQRGGTVPIDPRPRLAGTLDVLPDGRLRPGVADGMIPRYGPHWAVCPVARRLSEERLLEDALALVVAEGLEEGRRSPEPGQLSLLPPDPPPAWSRWKPGWFDLTDRAARIQSLPRPGHSGLVIDPSPPSNRKKARSD